MPGSLAACYELFPLPGLLGVILPGPGYLSYSLQYLPLTGPTACRTVLVTRTPPAWRVGCGLPR